MSSLNSYKDYLQNCKSDNIEPMSEKSWKKRHRHKNRKPNSTVYNKGQKEDLSRWNNAQYAPSLWEKMEKDLLFSEILEQRLDESGNTTMSNRVEVRYVKSRKIKK